MKRIPWFLVLIILWSIILLTPTNLEIKLSLLVLSLCIILWTSEIIPMWITGLIPLILGPLLGLILFEEIVKNYFSGILLLFISGFIFSSAVSKWKIDKKIVFSIMSIFGKNARLTILGVIISTALLSTLMANTTTTALMLPIGLGILTAIKGEGKEYRTSLLLSIAYAASIGGTGILIGTTTNLIGAEYMMRENMEIGFLAWAKIVMPFTLTLLAVLWLYMSWRTKLPKKIVIDIKKIKLDSHAKLVIFVLLLTVLAWLLRPYVSEKTGFQLNDIMIGLLGSLSLFLIRYKNKPLLRIKDVKIPWNIILMVGGALALGNILLNVGMSDIFVQVMGFLPRNELVFLIATAVIANFSTELISNTALSATLIPVIVQLYKSAGFDPFLGILTVAVCSDMAFMLPIATPPNAIVYKSKYVNFRKMVSYGFLLNIIVIVLWVLYASVFLM
ncbi:MAG: DASS family sodium-coupled anion symporter [Candidatus Aenigmarchaeota archaeon]|nr:DASS family sodium-coupled anion symporter [Candidatus Aenigmarchaeota archaeon]